MEKKQSNDYKYYQEMSFDNGLINKEEEKPVEENRVRLYTFEGAILRYGKCVEHHYTKTVMAVSKKQAWNNVLCAAKLKCGYLPSAGGFKIQGSMSVSNNDIDTDKIKVGQKVNVFTKGKTFPGIITEVFEPNEYHSGRFRVDIHFPNYTDNMEFWFGDFGKEVIPVEK